MPPGNLESTTWPSARISPTPRKMHRQKTKKFRHVRNRGRGGRPCGRTKHSSRRPRPATASPGRTGRCLPSGWCSAVFPMTTSRRSWAATCSALPATFSGEAARIPFTCASYNCNMEMLLPVLGIVYGALFIWATVRIVNQPTQWRKAARTAFLWLAPLILVPCLLSMIETGGHRTASQRSQCKNNMKQIGLALHNYAEMYGSFPPAYIADDNGRPMHSWRVLILPFIDQVPLYNQYRFDEPW